MPNEGNGGLPKDLWYSRTSIKQYRKLSDHALEELSRFGNVHEQEIVVISQKWI